MHTPEPITGTVLLIDRADRLPKQRAIFEEAGLDVVTAKSTEEGLAMARQSRPDLVVSEVMMEKADAGFVLAYRMKQDPSLSEVPVVLLSSIFQTTGTVFDLATPQERQWIKADLYLERPITPEHLIAKIRSLMQHPPTHVN